MPKSSAHTISGFRSCLAANLPFVIMKKIIGQVAWFVIVGCSAAATHWLVVVAAVSMAHLPPLQANVLGWLVAFGVSFAGHYTLTFRHQNAPLWQALRRF